MAEGPVGRIIRFSAFALAFFFPVASAVAGEFRIRHAEPITARAADITAQPASDGESRLSFQAYGR